MPEPRPLDPAADRPPRAFCASAESRATASWASPSPISQGEEQRAPAREATGLPRALEGTGIKLDRVAMRRSDDTGACTREDTRAGPALARILAHADRPLAKPRSPAWAQGSDAARRHNVHGNEVRRRQRSTPTLAPCATISARPSIEITPGDDLARARRASAGEQVGRGGEDRGRRERAVRARLQRRSPRCVARSSASCCAASGSRSRTGRRVHSSRLVVARRDARW
jgi:hypothetical protein